MGADGASGGDRPLSARSQAAALFGARLRGFRVRAGLSQAALAERAGLGVATVKLLERDQRPRPHPDTLARLAEALGLTPAERDALLAWPTGEPWPPTNAEVASPPAATEALGLVRLPVPPTALIGRAAEMAQISARLDPARGATRLLTLTGPGGVGKTRLAVAVAARLVDAYPDGVVFVDLAPLRDERLVSATVARALEVRESGGRSAHDLLLDHLCERQLLLVLDNFEHLLGAAPLLAELLADCPRLGLLVTSRVALRLRGEQRFTVPPLAAPADPPAPTDAHGLAVTAASPAVRLFVERAQASAPDFGLDASNAAAVAAICRRLDGMPLAIELAAARVGLLQPAALLRRLEHRLPLLVGGAVDLPERQQTLRTTLAWSYDLLDPAAQVLFRRLAVFAGGWTLEAAEAVCVDAALPAEVVLDGLQVLVDSSLVRCLDTAGGVPRFGMLETIREYALDHPATRGEAEDWRRRHARYFLALAEAVEPHLRTTEQVAWLDRLEQEHANLRSVLGWALRSGATDLALGLAAALSFFWSSRGYEREGCDWLMAALEHPAAGTPSHTRVRALNAAGFLQVNHGEHTVGQRLLQEGLALGRALDDHAAVAYALRYLGTVAIAQGEPRTARARLEEALALERYAEVRAGIPVTLMYLADAVQLLGEPAAAEALYRESAELMRALGNAVTLPYPLRRLGYLALRRGATGPAARLFEHSFALNRRASEPRGVAASLVGLATVASTGEAFATAARLLGAADALLADRDIQLMAVDRACHTQTTAWVRARLGDAGFAQAWRAGCELSHEHAVAEALSTVPPSEAAAPPAGELDGRVPARAGPEPGPAAGRPVAGEC